MKCLSKYKWVKLYRAALLQGKGIMGYWARLAGRAAFRHGNKGRSYEQFIEQFTNPTEDLLVDANQIDRYCIGCFGCWLKTPDTCIIQDGFENMGKILSEVAELILISKATFGGYSSWMQVSSH